MRNLGGTGLHLGRDEQQGRCGCVLLLSPGAVILNLLIEGRRFAWQNESFIITEDSKRICICTSPFPADPFM